PRRRWRIRPKAPSSDARPGLNTVPLRRGRPLDDAPVLRSSTPEGIRWKMPPPIFLTGEARSAIARHPEERSDEGSRTGRSSAGSLAALGMTTESRLPDG